MDELELFLALPQLNDCSVDSVVRLFQRMQSSMKWTFPPWTALRANTLSSGLLAEGWVGPVPRVLLS